MRLYKNGWFVKFARKEKISDKALCDAIKRAEHGLIDADLGGGLIKQRIARPGEGKSGGYRTIILFRTEVRGLFVYGFAKSERDNIDPHEQALYRKLAKAFLSLDDKQMERMAEVKQWTKVECDDQDL